MTDLIEREQQDEVGVYVQLYSIDITRYGGGIQYWSPSHPTADKPIIWNGNTYNAIDIEIGGVETRTSGSLARPQVSISNADNVVGALCEVYNDLIGCTVTRTRTLYEYLDDQPGADPTQYWPLNVWRIERIVLINPTVITFELASQIDAPNARLPRVPISKAVCLHRYRIFKDGAFVYTNASCPYAGNDYFDRAGNHTSAQLDACGKRVTDCKLRFGVNTPLPFGGFPGVGRS